MSITESINQTPTLACNVGAIPENKRQRWLETGKAVYSQVDSAKELVDGFAFRLPNKPGILQLTAEYVSYDSLCCSFIHWNIEVKPENESIWLSLTGGLGAKELTRITLETTPLLSEEIAVSLGLDLSKRRAWEAVIHEENLLNKSQPLMKKGITSKLKNIGIAGIGLCALLCSLPIIGAGLGISALVASTAHYEKISTVIFLLSVGVLGWWYFSRRKNSPSCDINCDCKTES